CPAHWLPWRMLLVTALQIAIENTASGKAKHLPSVYPSTGSARLVHSFSLRPVWMDRDRAYPADERRLARIMNRSVRELTDGLAWFLQQARLKPLTLWLPPGGSRLPHRRLWLAA